MAIVEEPIISRLDRLDIILKQLEDIRVGYCSPKSSTASTESTLTSGGQAPPSDFSPKGLDVHSRPLDDALLEVEMKGTVMGRLLTVEQRVMKLQEEVEAERKKEELRKKPSRRGLQRLFKSCMKTDSKDQ